MDALAPPMGWQPSRVDVPWMPATLLRLPRTNVLRAKYPVIDFHLHAGNTTPQLIQLMDRVGVAAEVNLNGGTGASIDSALKASEPYRDRVADFMTWSDTLNGININDPRYPAAWAAELERGFKAGAMGLKVAKGLGLAAKNPDGTVIQADDPRLDAGWEMCAKYNKPVMIHLSDSIGRFYPISSSNERYEAGLWHGRRGELLQERVAVARADREGAREYARQASADDLRQRPHGDAVLRPCQRWRRYSTPIQTRWSKRRRRFRIWGARRASGETSSSSIRIAFCSAPTAIRGWIPTRSGCALPILRDVRRILRAPGADSSGRRFAGPRSLEHLGHRLAGPGAAEGLLPERAEISAVVPAVRSRDRYRSWRNHRP